VTIPRQDLLKERIDLTFCLTMLLNGAITGKLWSSKIEESKKIRTLLIITVYIMKKILHRIFHILRYMICTPFILVFGLVTAPLSLIFGWKGFYILYIANQENCFFTQARQILAKEEKYKIVSNSLLINGSPLIVVHRNGYIPFSNKTGFNDTEQQHYSPMYSHLPQNIFYDYD
jgi:hypothetical protein